MKELTVSVTLPKFLENFDEVKESIAVSLKQYDIAVDESNVKEAKSLATNLNKMRTKLKSEVKKVVDEALAPVEHFKGMFKEIDSLIEDQRQQLLGKTKQFDDAKKLEHRKALNKYLMECIDNAGVRDSYASLLTVNGLESISGLTSTGNLNKKSKDSVDAIVLKAKGNQDADYLRIAEQKIIDEKRVAEQVEAKLQQEREQERRREEKKHQEELDKAREVQTPAYQDPRPPEHRGGDTSSPQAHIQEQPPMPKPQEEEKAVFEITLTYQIASKSSADLTKLLNKVMPLIESGKLPITSKSARKL